MNINKRNLQSKIPKKISCLSFNELDIYFKTPDMKIQDLHAISARQFTNDLNSMMEFSRKNSRLHGKIDKFSITMNSNTAEKGKRCHLTNYGPKREKLKLHKILNKLFKYESRPIKKIKIKSWNFTDFDDVEQFQVGKFYAIKPVGLTYNTTREDYKYNEQIISEFCIEEANGNIKKLIIVDTMKNGKVRRKKYIDGQKMNRQHYDFEIRNHRLCRNLMKTYLFHQIYKCKMSECYQDDSLRHNKTDSNFAGGVPAVNESCQAKEIGIIPEEYCKISLFKEASHRKNKYENVFAVDDHSPVQEIFEMETDSICAADGYADLKRAKRLIFS